MNTCSYSGMAKKYGSKAYDRTEVNLLLREAADRISWKIVTLDDDPTGVQTVHDVNVYTDWSLESIREGFLEKERMFYILTNSRAMTEAETAKAHREIAERVCQASEETGKPFLLICRGDSTLRGHYPLETEVLYQTLSDIGAEKPDGEILAPFFGAGGRYTFENIHYVRYGDELVPAGETEFAADRTFGYVSSDLKEYIEEKTKGRNLASGVISVSLESLRNADYGKITDQLLGVRDFQKVIVNALEPSDLEVFCVSLYRALAQGKRFLFRTAADFVKAVGLVEDKDLLTHGELMKNNGKHGGIVVVGSHTEKTTRQLERLRDLPGLEFMEFNSDLVLEDKLESEVERVVSESGRLIENGCTAVIYTKRKLLVVDGDSKEEALKRSVKISDAVWKLVADLDVCPAFVVAKGGITSNDIGVRALKVKKALVSGQILPGVPVWRTGAESRFPGIPYIIFPGNVGEEDSLKKVVEKLIDGGME